jgi:hypothetical protein
MIRIAFPESAEDVSRTGSTGTGASSGSLSKVQRGVPMSCADATLLRNLLEAQKQKIMDGVHSAEELQLANLLDDLDCEPEITKAMLVSVLCSTNVELS